MAYQVQFITNTPDIWVFSQSEEGLCALAQSGTQTPKAYLALDLSAIPNNAVVELDFIVLKDSSCQGAFAFTSTLDSLGSSWGSVYGRIASGASAKYYSATFTMASSKKYLKVANNSFHDTSFVWLVTHMRVTVNGQQKDLVNASNNPIIDNDMPVSRNEHYLDNAGLETLWGLIKAKFQEQEAGKGLSTNDYTTAEKNKLAGIAEGAEVNVQSDWSQSDSSADDYIKNKPQVYTKSEIDSMFTANVKYSVVSTLPETGTAGTIYLVPSATSQTGDVYEEYMWVPADGQTAAHFEKIGTTQADLSGKQDTIPAKGSTTKPVYFSAAGTVAECSTYAGGTKVTLNGTNKGGAAITVYAPTAVGTAGQYLKSAGSGAPTWESFDTAPASGSGKGITSGAVHTALAGKVNTADFITDAEIAAICV